MRLYSKSSDRGKRSSFKFAWRKHPKGTALVVNSTRVRSTLEAQILEQLIEQDAHFIYEGAGFKYTTSHIYTPDFVLKTRNNKSIYIEAKGWFTSKDRTKMLIVKKQNKHIDIRFIFTNPNARLYKGSKTTYAEWADKYGFPWAKSLIPKEWIHE